ncbi:hypothetical protein WPS_12720 [Vulcanimicrobium alpinum]|uniref:Uncharacterized protein n=1 Tax=Vulcanimicrobium alpinum TaxID=3016050 RepID=A0AAN2C9G7_UNVUL|nr:hypothetical protein WPS_12720 [Vulcanimicrobium alpinum]
MESNDGGQAGRRKTRQTSSLTYANDEPELQQIWDLTSSVEQSDCGVAGVAEQAPHLTAVVVMIDAEILQE